MPYERELRRACQSGPKTKVIELLNKGSDPNSKVAEDEYGNKPLHYACEHGWLDIVEKLVEECKCDVNARQSAGRPWNSETPLHIACKYGHSEIAKLLIEKYQCNPNVKDSKGMTPLHYAFRSGKFEIAKLLINMNVCDHLNAKDKDRRTPLHYACNFNRTDLIEELISHGAKPNVSDSDGNTLIHYCVQCNVQVKTIICLLKVHKFDLNIKNKYGATPLLLLAKSRPEHVATLMPILVSNGADPDTTDNDGNTLLHVACKTGSLESVKHFLKFRNYDPNAKNNSGFTPLQIISTMGFDPKLINKLIKHGANPNVTDSDGNTLLHNACHNGSYLRVKFLLNAKCDPNIKNKYGLMPLQVTSLLGSDIIQELITHGANPNVTDGHGNTLLHKACKSRYLCNTVKVILNATDCDPNIKNKSGLTPLQVAHFDIMQELITHGANPNVINSDGNTLIHQACQNNQYGFMKCLLNSVDCDPNIKNYDGLTPIQMTTDNLIIEVLITLGANPNVTDSDGNTPLHIACEKGMYETVNCLLNAVNCDPNVKNKFGLTPLQVTSLFESDHDILIQELITHGANPNVTDSDGNTLLHKACQKNIKNIVKILLSSDDCDPNLKNKSGLTPLQVTLPWKYGIIQNLITHGANPNVTDSDGNTLLHIACQENRNNVTKILLSSAICNPNAQNRDGLTPLQVTSDATIIRELIRHGAYANDVYKTHGRLLKQPLKPPVKVFVVGNPSVGKSTLTSALQKENSFLRRTFTTPQKITGVDTKTAGVVPHDFKSKEYGYAIIYDFAGQREFYGSHAALLQNIIQSSPPVFIIVVDLRKSEDEIKQTIQYWLIFLDNQCTSVSGKPHVIIVGSHADILKERREDPILKTNNSKTNMDNFVFAGFIAMDCQYPESNGMDELRQCLKKSCKTLRTRETITFNAHCFYIYLVDKFKDATAVTIEQIQSQITAESPQDGGVMDFIPQSLHHLCKICDELNDRGHVLFLSDPHTIEQSWVVIDKRSLLTQVSGSIFAPEHFKQYKVITQCTCSTGVVPLSSIAKSFPDHNPELLIKFLSSLEFCHEISDPEILHCITAEHTTCVETERNPKERYFLFPALVSLNVPSNVWDNKPEYTHYCGWIIHCLTDIDQTEQFFTSRFLQVLLLRIAFSFPLSEGDPLQPHPAIKRNCSIWKNGIFWGSNCGVETLFEVSPDNKAVIVLMRCHDNKEGILELVQLRSQIISKVLRAAHEFCRRIDTVESFIDPSKTMQYPLKQLSQLKLFSMLNTTKAVLCTRTPVTVVSPTGTILLENLLQYEPYAGLGEDILRAILKSQDSNNIEKVGDSFLSRIAERTAKTSNPNLFIKIFDPEYESSDIPIESAILSVLKTWRARCAGTYKSLRKKLDEFSSFAGRNTLNLVLDTVTTTHVQPEKALISQQTVQQKESVKIEQTSATQMNELAPPTQANDKLGPSQANDYVAPTQAKEEVVFTHGTTHITEGTPPVQDIDSAEEMQSSVTTKNGVQTEAEYVLKKSDTPTLQQLLVLKAGEKTVRVIESVAAQWEQLALALEIRTSVIGILRRNFRDDCEGAATQVLIKWLNGESDLDQPITWNTLIQCLNEAGKVVLAEDLAEMLALKDNILGCSNLQ